MNENQRVYVCVSDADTAVKMLAPKFPMIT